MPQLDCLYEKGKRPSRNIRLKEFSCKQCGNWCENLSGVFIMCADKEDIEQWEKK